MKKILKRGMYVLIGLFIIFIIVGGGFGANSGNVINANSLIFAHRGVIEGNAENSIEAFEKARVVGFKAIETDVNVTKDGKLIIFHDHDCIRLLGRDQLLSDLTWEEIQDLYLHYNRKETSSKVLSLEQFLESQNDSTVIYLDIKVFSIEVANNLVSILNKYKSNKKIIVADSNLFYLSYLKYRNTELIVALEGFNKGKEWLYSVIPKNFKADYYASRLSEVDEDHMLFLSENDLLNRKIVYGVNSANLSEVYRLGIRNIIYDYDSQAANIAEIELLIHETSKNQ